MKPTLQPLNQRAAGFMPAGGPSRGHKTPRSPLSGWVFMNTSACSPGRLARRGSTGKKIRPGTDRRESAVRDKNDRGGRAGGGGGPGAIPQGGGGRRPPATPEHRGGLRGRPARGQAVLFAGALLGGESRPQAGGHTP